MSRTREFLKKLKHDLCSGLWNFNFGYSATVFIMIELLVCISAAFCQFLINDEKVWTNIGKSIKSPMYFHQVTDAVAMISGIILGYLADSYTGKHVIVLLGTMFAALAPMFSLTLKFSSFYTKLKIFSLYATRCSIACCLATTGVRAALFMDQLRPETFGMNKLKNYIFIYWFVRTFAYAFSAFLFFCSTFNPNITFWHNIFICSTVPFVILMTYFVKQDMDLEPIMRGCLKKCFVTAHKSLSWNITIEHHKKKWEFIVHFVEPSTFFLRTRLMRLCVIIIPFFSVGLNTYILEEWIKEYSQVYDIDWKQRIIWFSTCCLLILGLIILPIIRFLILPCLRPGGHIIDFKLLTISMFILFLASMCVYGIMEALNRGYTPLKSYGQIRIYNGHSFPVTVESEWFSSRFIRESVALIVNDIPCNLVCNSTLIVSVHNQHHQQFPIQAKESASLTYVLLSNSIKKLNIEDPTQNILKRPEDKAVILVFSNMYNFQGTLNIHGLSYQVILQDQKNNSMLIEVAIGTGLITGVGPEKEHFASTIEVNFQSRGIYSLLIYSSVFNQTTLTLDVIALSIHPLLVRFLLIILLGPSVLLCISKVLVQMTLLHFLYTECPCCIASFVYSLAFCSLGFGPIIWIEKGTMMEIDKAFIITISITQLLAILLFLVIISNYITNFRDIMATEKYTNYYSMQHQRNVTYRKQYTNK